MRGLFSRQLFRGAGESGATSLEHAILAALIAVAALAAIVDVGRSVDQTFNNVALATQDESMSGLGIAVSQPGGPAPPPPRVAQ